MYRDDTYRSKRIVRIETAAIPIGVTPPAINPPSGPNVPRVSPKKISRY
jgi:hypothetical protein